MPVGIFPVGLRVQRYYRRIAGLSDCFSLIRFDSLSYSFVTQLLSKYSVNPDFYFIGWCPVKTIFSTKTPHS